MLIYSVCLNCCLEFDEYNGFAKPDLRKIFDITWSGGFVSCCGRNGGTLRQLINRNSEPPYNCPYILEYTVSKESC